MYGTSQLYLVWLFGVALVAALTLNSILFARAYAAGPVLDQAFVPDGQPHVLLPNATAWFQFDYRGDKTPIEVRLAAPDGSNLCFALYTPDQIAARAAGVDAKPIGQLAREGNGKPRDLLWSGAFNHAGTYGIAVHNGMNSPVTYQLSVTGLSIHYEIAASTLDTTPAQTPALPMKVVPSSDSRPGLRVHVPILLYHHLQVLLPTAGRALQLLTVSPRAFGQQVAYLAMHQFHTIRFADLIAYFRAGTPLPDHAIILTFDDGWREDYTIAYPTLARYGMSGTFFPPTAYLYHSSLSLTWAQVQAMSVAGMEFGDHTVDHPYLTKESGPRLHQELVASKAQLEAALHQRVLVLAYPYGAYNTTVVNAAVQAGYEAAVVVGGSNYQDFASPFALHRMPIPYWYDLTTFAEHVQ